MIEQGAYLNQQDHNGNTPLKLAVSEDNIISAMSFTKVGADFGYGTLEQATKLGHIMGALKLSG